MDLEQRVETLERETEILKKDIRGTLLDVQESLSEKSASPGSLKAAGSLRWQKKAWALALLNLLIAIILFTNIRFYTSDTSPASGPLLNSWLQAFWVALAFVWLILQMYPLALLLDQNDKQQRDAAWRNTAALFRSNPGLTLALTLSVLVVAVISALFPSLWFLVAAMLFVSLCVNATGRLLTLHRQQSQTGEREK